MGSEGPARPLFLRLVFIFADNPPELLFPVSTPSLLYFPASSVLAPLGHVSAWTVWAAGSGQPSAFSPPLGHQGPWCPSLRCQPRLLGSHQLRAWGINPQGVLTPAPRGPEALGVGSLGDGGRGGGQAGLARCDPLRVLCTYPAQSHAWGSRPRVGMSRRAPWLPIALSEDQAVCVGTRSNPGPGDPTHICFVQETALLPAPTVPSSWSPVAVNRGPSVAPGLRRCDSGQDSETQLCPQTQGGHQSPYQRRSGAVGSRAAEGWLGVRGGPGEAGRGRTWIPTGASGRTQLGRTCRATRSCHFTVVATP